MTTLKAVVEGNDKSATVRWNADYQEYVVKFFVGWVHQKAADYFTADKDDAIGTAKLHCGGLEPVVVTLK